MPSQTKCRNLKCSRYFLIVFSKILYFNTQVHTHSDTHIIYDHMIIICLTCGITLICKPSYLKLRIWGVLQVLSRYPIPYSVAKSRNSGRKSDANWQHRTTCMFAFKLYESRIHRFSKIHYSIYETGTFANFDTPYSYENYFRRYS